MVVNNAQQSNRPGWQAQGTNRSRYWIVENFNNGQMVDLRKALYSYHRLALDTFDKDPDKSRTLIRLPLESGLQKSFDLLPVFGSHSVIACLVHGKARPWPFATLT